MSRNHLINHPGRQERERSQVVRGQATRVEVQLQAGTILMDAVATASDDLGCDSALQMLDGLKMGPYNFVKPTMNSPDGKLVAWYSETFHGQSATLEHAMASVGRKDGEWFLHCHAVWDSETDNPKSGHLLPFEVTVEQESTIICYAFKGGEFDVTYSEETFFSTFRAKPKTGSIEINNAALITLSPHEDLGKALPQIANALEFKDCRVLGLGSLIGADFESGPSMEAAASEVLLLPSATPTHLPLHCIGSDWKQYRGLIVPGTVPVCITFELLLIDISV